MRKTSQSKRRINGGKAAKIEEKGFGKWESLDQKLMLDIFNRLEPAFLLTTVAWVCRSWGRACYDRFFAEKGEQNTLNLRALRSMSFWNIRINFTKLHRGVMDVYACDNDDDDDYVDGGVRVRVTPITEIMFPSEFVTVTDDHLVYAAKRAMQCWSRIEEMTISFNDCDSDNHDVGSIIEVIGINCKKLEVLCLFGLFIGCVISKKGITCTTHDWQIQALVDNKKMHQDEEGEVFQEVTAQSEGSTGGGMKTNMLVMWFWKFRLNAKEVGLSILRNLRLWPTKEIPMETVRAFWNIFR
ncbi:unnamed protein product [Camellia sinensis]